MRLRLQRGSSFYDLAGAVVENLIDPNLLCAVRPILKVVLQNSVDEYIALHSRRFHGGLRVLDGVEGTDAGSVTLLLARFGLRAARALQMFFLPGFAHRLAGDRRDVDGLGWRNRLADEGSDCLVGASAQRRSARGGSCAPRPSG